MVFFQQYNSRASTVQEGGISSYVKAEQHGAFSPVLLWRPGSAFYEHPPKRTRRGAFLGVLRDQVPSVSRCLWTAFHGNYLMGC